jgi:hypothetical protein
MNFLEELQALDDRTKQKILIITTIVIMIIVIYFWLAYFNNLVAGVSQSATGASIAVTSDTTNVAPAPTASSAPVVAAQAPGESIWQKIGAGFMSVMRGIASVFQSPRQYIVKP